MSKIKNKFQLLKKVNLNKNIFINDELKPFISQSFSCIKCDSEVKMKIIPYQSGYPFFELYRNEYLSKSQIINDKLAQPASKINCHYGEYLVFDLPTLYNHITCTNCYSNYIMIFGLGESQPSKWVCKISGIWLFKFID